MTQEKKRNYRRKPVDNLASAATEMGNIPPQALDMEEVYISISNLRHLAIKKKP